MLAVGIQMSWLFLSITWQCAENTKFLVRASYLEIYNEDVRDLLGTDTKQKLEVGVNTVRGKDGPREGRDWHQCSLRSMWKVSWSHRHWFR